MRYRYLFLLFTVMFCGCVTVNLTVENPTKVKHEVSVTVKDDKGLEKTTLELGTVSPDKSLTHTFEVKPGWAFTVKSRLPRSAELFEETRTVGEEPDPLEVTIQLEVEGRYLDDTTAQKTLTDMLADLGEDKGFKPIPLHNGLQTSLGALYVLTPSTGKVHFKLTPAQFSRVTTMDDFRYPQTVSIRKVEISSSAASKLGVNVPLYASFGISSTSNEVFELESELSGFGWYEKIESPGWNYINAIHNLNEELGTALYNAWRDNPGSIILYVNKMYVIKRARLVKNKGVALTIDSKVDAASVVTASGAFTFSDENAETKTFDDEIINIDGIQLYLAQVSLPAAGTASPGPAASSGPPGPQTLGSAASSGPLGPYTRPLGGGLLKSGSFSMRNVRVGRLSQPLKLSEQTKRQLNF